MNTVYLVDLIFVNAFLPFFSHLWRFGRPAHRQTGQLRDEMAIGRDHNAHSMCGPFYSVAERNKAMVLCSCARTCLSDRNDVIVCIPTRLSRARKKNIRNEMRQPTLIENLYKCLFVVAIVAEIYKMDRLVWRVCFVSPGLLTTHHVMHTKYSIVSKSTNLLPVAVAFPCDTHGSAATPALFFFVAHNKCRNGGKWKKWNECNWRKVKWFSSIILSNDSVAGNKLRRSNGAW